MEEFASFFWAKKVDLETVIAQPELGAECAIKSFVLLGDQNAGKSTMLHRHLALLQFCWSCCWSTPSYLCSIVACLHCKAKCCGEWCRYVSKNGTPFGKENRLKHAESTSWGVLVWSKENTTHVFLHEHWGFCRSGDAGFMQLSSLLPILSSSFINTRILGLRELKLAFS